MCLCSLISNFLSLFFTSEVILHHTFLYRPNGVFIRQKLECLYCTISADPALKWEGGGQFPPESLGISNSAKKSRKQLPANFIDYFVFNAYFSCRKLFTVRLVKPRILCWSVTSLGTLWSFPKARTESKTRNIRIGETWCFVAGRSRCSHDHRSQSNSVYLMNIWGIII